MTADRHDHARVVGLFLKPSHRQPMQSVPWATADAGKGLRGDASYGRTRRQILLVSEELLLDLDLKPGDVRENVILRGVTAEDYSPGDRLTIGTAVLEVSMDCQPCERMDEFRPGLQGLLRGRRGMLAKVVVGGTIRVGDEVLAAPASRPATSVYPMVPRSASPKEVTGGNQP
jgi:MOSC domain-containing protein YiiM